ncbi:MAG: SDR family NAD(P)-dependent oxidoreductase, partial [Chloroflexi bacterium]|nr:SDR family NAD(P)-dependent oxidoreductase [Chloroflexota bacterium]
MRLEGKVALITGAGAGIGRAAAVRFAAEGARIVASDINDASASETAALVGEAGGEATSVGGDVARSADAAAMVQTAMDSYGRLDVLLNSAGVSGRIDLGENATHEDVWDKVMDVNMKGTYLVSWHAVSEMENTGGGSIINIGSIMSLVGYPVGMTNGFSPYNPSKGAVLQFTRNLAVDLAPK